MPKKSFRSQVKGADRLFGANDSVDDAQDVQATRDAQDVQAMRDVQDAQSVQATRDVQDAQSVQATRAARTERLSLRLDSSIKEYISEAAWRQRMSVTEYICSLVRADMKAKQLEEGEPE